jgi:hypothetical protein
MTEKSVTPIAFAFVVVAFCAFVLFASAGPRGSDQYWYIADVQTLADGRPRVTNDVFPVDLLATGQPQRARFIHDTLNLYLIWPLAKFLGSYRAWILANLLSSLACAALIAHMAFVVTARNAAFASLAGCAYLLYPLSFWLACQPLVEATSAIFVVVALWAFIVLRHPIKYFIIVAALGFSLWCRGSLLPLLGLAALLPLLEWRARRTFAVVMTVSMLALAFAFVVSTKFLFHSSMPTSFKAVLLNGMPGGSNMDFLFLPTLPFTWNSIVEKFAKNLAGQFWTQPAALQLFYLPFNLLALLVLALALKPQTPVELRRLCWIAAAFIAVHVMTILLHQNQARYILLSFPILIVCAAAFLHQKRWRIKPLPTTVAFLCALAAVAYTARSLRMDSARHKTVRAGIQAAVNGRVTEQDIVMLEGLSPIITATLAPRMVVTLSERSSPELTQQVAKLSHAHWFIRRVPSKLQFNSTSNAVAKFEGFGVQYELIQLQ